MTAAALHAELARVGLRVLADGIEVDGDLPDDLAGATDYYRPTDRGFEARLQERWTWLKGRLGRGGAGVDR